MSFKKELISLYSGALGLDLGLEKAGFVLKAAVECDQIAIQTIKKNQKHLNGKDAVIFDKKLSMKNIAGTCQEILKRTGLTKRRPFLLAGAPPCQPFSTAGKRASFEDDRSCGFKVFFKAIRILRPRFFVIENVKGILSAAKKHRTLAERGPGFPQLTPDEEHGSAFMEILNGLSKICKEMDYCVSWGIVNAADYGCPQVRERIVFIGSLDGHFVWPERTHSKEGEMKWVALKDGLKGLKDPKPLYRKFNDKISNYLRLIPEGSNWRALPKYLHSKAIGGAFVSWGGRSGFLRRLSWGKPSPTITNNPKTKATMLCHPTKTRPLSVKECARIQQFPDNWKFSGSAAAQYRQIGNATPVGIGEAIGLAIKNAEKKQETHKGKLYCADPGLLKRIIGRPKTMLNPPRMRKIKDPQKARVWLNGSANKRTDFKKYMSISAAMV